MLVVPLTKSNGLKLLLIEVASPKAIADVPAPNAEALLGFKSPCSIVTPPVKVFVALRLAWFEPVLISEPVPEITEAIAIPALLGAANSPVRVSVKVPRFRVLEAVPMAKVVPTASN